MRLFGLIGHPLGHSFSKAYFQQKFQEEHLDCQYQNFDIDHIEAIQQLVFQHPELRGFNVTSPYKQAIIPFLDQLDDVAREIHAVNTVTRSANGKTTGYNTDVEGFDQLLNVSEFTKYVDNKTYEGSAALVLGTGGASQAVQFVLRRKNIKYQTVSRRHLNGNFSYEDLDDEIINSHLLIINATPLGTYPEIDAFPSIPYKSIGCHHTLIDLVYNPEETAFLRMGKSHGAKTFNGITMLHAQAEASWRIWNKNNS